MTVLRWECNVFNGRDSWTYHDGTTAQARGAVVPHRAGDWIAYVRNGSLVFSGPTALEDAKRYVEQVAARTQPAQGAP